MALRETLASMVILTGATIGVSSTATAASDGAFVQRERVCFPFDNGELCTTVKRTVNTAMTKSGFSSTVNGNWTEVYTENGVVQWTSSQKLRLHLLVKRETIAQEKLLLDAFTTRSGLICTTTYRFHSANGRIQHDVQDSVCTPP